MIILKIECNKIIIIIIKNDFFYQIEGKSYIIFLKYLSHFT